MIIPLREISLTDFTVINIAIYFLVFKTNDEQNTKLIYKIKTTFSLNL